MQNINAMSAMKLAGSLNSLLELLKITPFPEKSDLATVQEIKIKDETYYMTTLKVAYKNKEDAERFKEIDEILSEFAEIIHDFAEKSKKKLEKKDD